MMNRHSLDDKMTTVAFENTAREWARALETREAGRSGIPVRMARKTIARKIGVAPGTLENLANGRMKRLSAWCFERLRGAVVAELQQEIGRCQHELEIARQCGLDPRSAEISALANAVITAKTLIKDVR